MSKKIKKVLVANRGEIAIRIFRACTELGITTVAMYSQEDTYNLFRTKADESYLIGKNHTPLGAYLDIPSIIRLAKAKSIDAIHPGYGFLSENAEFARACEENEIIFIGPPPEVLEKMGNKLNAKEIAKSCNVPVIPGSSEPIADEKDALDRANSYGFPIILKASAGGGGKGMRRIDNEQELKTALPLVQSEALKSFGSADIFMEKFLVEPKHIEVQVLADKHKNVVHLFERDCSVQRRFQKVVEFAPAISIPEKTKQALYADAVKIAKAVDYVNAGTVEFLVDKDGNYYFIEMNPRIQVEHTVTEVVTDIDLVQSQILIAEGRKLSDPGIDISCQDDIKMLRAAIQCRVTTEDPRNNFSPDTGKLTMYRSGGGLGVRLDAGNAFVGAEISPYYDSLLVKLTTFDRTFEGAVRKALRALNEIRIRGVKTNIQFLNNVLLHPTFASADCHTTFIDDTPSLNQFTEPKDRATKILKYLGDKAVNDSRSESQIYDAAPIPVAKGEIKPGLKQLLDEKGPNAVRDFCLNADRLLISDTTLRDAHQSLLATRVRTKDMSLIADYMARTMEDVFALEMWGGATFDVAYRFLHESPWERLEVLRNKIPNTLFMMLLRGANAVGYTNYPDNLIRQFIKEAARSGIDVFRVFDSLNWLPNMEVSIDEVLNQNKVVEGYICYSGDISDPSKDKYNLKYYVNLAKELERRGVHILGIKDMSGLLKPYAAHKLVSTLKNEIGLPIHLHTHDTAGNGVATVLKAAEAGVDIVDTAISAMSSLTSQPSLNAVITALQGHERDTLMSDEKLLPISEYWEHVRGFYSKFEEGLDSPATDIYRYEIPGGQYSNFRAQIESLGLGDRFHDVKEKYKEVNDMLGDIIKVTPSSKMVGDFAIFMVQNDMDAKNIVQKGKNLAFPDSVVTYFEGMMGQPQGGFPPDIQEVVLKGKTPITGRPGEYLPPVDFDKISEEMSSFCPNPSVRDIVSYCLYPNVLKNYHAHVQEYSALTALDTPIFFNGLNLGETTEVEIEDGKTLFIKLVSIGELDSDNCRNVVFELNGHRRETSVPDTSVGPAQSSFIQADMENPMEIGAGIPGMISKLHVSVGDVVEKNDILAVIEAMKMETVIVSKAAGVIEQIFIKEHQTVKVGELLMRMTDKK